MPVPAVIAAAAENYRFNSKFLENSVKDLAPEEWLRRPCATANHVAWIVGHVIWTRKQLLRRLGKEWSQPWMEQFARGTKLDEDAAYPAPDALLDAWRESSALLEDALASVPEDALAQPSTNGAPSADGKVSGVVNFLAIHETYHGGQISYLRSWLGHKGMMG
ncbi:MAG: DinB family protein [Terracidiphilus sp.]